MSSPEEASFDHVSAADRIGHGEDSNNGLVRGV